MLTLHHLNHSRSFRILWLLEELHAAYGTPFELIIHQRNKNFLAPSEMTQIHPMGKAPILVDGAAGKTLVESGFIIEYLLKHYDKDKKFSPSDDNWEDFTFWLHFSESSMMPPLVMRLVMQKVATKSPIFVRPIAKAIAKKVDDLMVKDNVSQSFSLLNNHLADKSWIAGDFSAANIQAYFATKAMQSRGGIDRWHHIQRWLDDCENRTAYQNAVAKGGKLFG